LLFGLLPGITRGRRSSGGRFRDSLALAQSRPCRNSAGPEL